MTLKELWRRKRILYLQAQNEDTECKPSEQATAHMLIDYDVIVPTKATATAYTVPRTAYSSVPWCKSMQWRNALMRKLIVDTAHHNCIKCADQCAEAMSLGFTLTFRK